MKLLKAGPLEVGYENGFLRRITYGESEILRMIYFALRDHNWNTFDSRIENEIISTSDEDFEITYDCFHLFEGQVPVMEWKVRIKGQKDGTFIFEIRGTAKQNFRKNRAGFCMLHPLHITGQDCTITHPDHSESTHRFPEYVAADNPFKNIQSMTWAHAGVLFTLEFEGDIFETEDQRNWGDASFKTFCTPLNKPFPVELKKGSGVFQRITFKPVSALPAVAGRTSHISLTDNGLTGKLPRIGITASTETAALPEAAVILLRAVKFHHYRIDVYPYRADWVTDFSKGYENAFALSLPLEVVLHLSDKSGEELDSFVIICQQNRVRLKQVLLLAADHLVTPQIIIDQIPRLKGELPNVLFGAGTNYNFNEVNKNHFDANAADFISFSMDPQEHAFDGLTILENSSTPAYLINSARSIYGADKPVHLSPLTLRKRFNPYATNPADLYIDESLKADPRQKEVFAAVWTFCSLCNLARGQASAITFFQTIGNQGILSGGGDPYPVYETLKSFSPFQGKPVNLLESSDSLAVQGVLLDDKILALVNLTQEEKTVRWNEAEFVLGPQEIKFHTLNRA